MGLKEFNKSLGKKLTRNKEIVVDPTKKVERISSGCMVLDMITGGGFPRGGLVEIFGLEHSGKTSLAFSTMARIQRLGGVCLMFDAEHAYNHVYAEDVFGLKIDNETFTLLDPNNAEEMGVVLDMLLEGKLLEKLDLLVIDSVGALKTKSQIESTLDANAVVGAHARLMGRIVPKLELIAKMYGCVVLLINQMRSTIQTGFTSGPGIAAGVLQDSNYTTTGGKALPYAAKMRVQVSHATKLVDEAGRNLMDGTVQKIEKGMVLKFSVRKNKVSAPSGTARATFMFNPKYGRVGWDNNADLIDALTGHGRLVQKGIKLTYRGLYVDEWSHSRSKEACVRAFLSDENLMADGRALLSKIIGDGLKLKLELDFEDKVMYPPYDENSVNLGNAKKPKVGDEDGGDDDDVDDEDDEDDEDTLILGDDEVFGE